MKRILGLPLLLAVLVTSAVAQGNSKGGWDAVRRLDRGTSISLKAKRDVKCEFVDATEVKLFCDQIKWLRASDRLVFDRVDIRQVRVREDLPDDSNPTANAAIGAALGVGLGAIANAAHPESGTDGRFLFGVMGAVIGGAGFGKVHIVHVNRTIYRR